MKRQWALSKIISDLKKLKARGATPNPYELKSKYGYALNSEFFPVLEHIGNTVKGMKKFVGGIFKRVLDPRDLGFRLGPCHCPMCRE